VWRRLPRAAAALSAAWLFAGGLACGGAKPPAGGAPELAVEGGGDGAPAPEDGAPTSEAGGEGAPSPGKPAPLERPKGPLPRKEAQQYLLALINRDRAAQGLPAVAWDETAAQAARRHAEDMAHNGFTGHWGTDGSVPEERYTAAGGDGLVMENAGCLGDAVAREPDPDPRFTVDSIERVQSTFMAEVPPHDGHKRNILTRSHTSVGLGLAKPKDIDVACMAQEFVDHYGTYEVIPKKAKVGDVIRVAGEIRAPATIAGVGLSRVDAARPRKPKELVKMGGYPIPKPYVTYFPKGYKTPIPLEVAGNSFHIQVPLDDARRPGLYGVTVWVTFGSSKELRIASLRTIQVEKAGAK